MQKLIIKQEVGVNTRRRSVAKWLSIGGLLTLLLTVAVAAAYFTNKPLPTSDLEPLTFESAEIDTAGYQSLQAILGDLMAEYAGLAERGLDDYQKNLMLSGKAESILAHLTKMDGVSNQLRLNAKEHREVTDRHQFYNDFWQAKLHFRQLRISRFEKAGINDLSDANAVPEEAELPGDETVAIAEQPKNIEQSKKKFQFAKPPEGMEMPAGFCDLSNPDSCKADGEQAVAVIDEAVDSQSSQSLQDEIFDANATEAADEQPPKKKFQFAKPPEGMEMPAGFCDLSNPDSCKADGEQAVAVIDDAVDSQSSQSLQDEIFDANVTETADEQPPKRKFQFAKPPEGMEMPAGFCDLSNPDSCKADGESAAELIVPNIGDLPLPDEIQDESIAGSDGTIETPGKRKFQFAKPPEGMALPAGFCDLSNPASCKKEGDLLSDADKPVLDVIVEPTSNENKDQL